MKYRRMTIFLVILAFVLSVLGGCASSDDALVNHEPTEPTVSEVPAETKKAHTQEYVMIKDILGDTLIYDLADDDVLAPYYEMAETRRADILNTKTEIVKSDVFIPGQTYTGNAYYISPSGNNENDGLSPETAWQTAHRANWGDVHEGDAVFFE